MPPVVTAVQSAEVAAVVAAECSKDVAVLVKVRLGAGDHGASHARLLRPQLDGTDADSCASAPRVFYPPVAGQVEHEVGTEPPHLPVTVRVSRRPR